MASFPIEKSPTDAVRRLLRLPSRYQPEEQTAQSLATVQGYGDFEPSEQELIEEQREATTTLPSGSFTTPSRESLRDKTMQKVREMLNLDTRKHGQEMEKERLTQEGLNKRAAMSAEQGARPYYTPLQTAEGWQAFDARTGKVAGRLGDYKPSEGMSTFIGQASGIQRDFENVKRFYDPAKIGPLSGRFGRLEQAIAGNDPDAIELFASTSRIRNAIIQLRSGAQVTEGEAQRVLAELPDVTQPPTTFVTRLANAERAFNEVVRGRTQAGFGRLTGEDVTRMATTGVAASPQPASPVAAQPSAQDLIKKYRGGR